MSPSSHPDPGRRFGGLTVLATLQGWCVGNRMADRLASARRSHFVGRRAEVAQFLALLDSREGAVVFVHGPGGIGQTTLLEQFGALAGQRGPGRRAVGRPGRHAVTTPQLAALCARIACRLRYPCARSAHQRRGVHSFRWSGPPALGPCPSRVSLYDLCVVGDEQIQKWAEEAEAGYDVAELKRRGRGRPGRGAEPAQVVAVRLTAEELEALDAAAKRQDLSRSEAIRAALAHFAA